jgi:uncharacterized membrane protein YdjX (TVP38/TMEM64 family)
MSIEPAPAASFNMKSPYVMIGGSLLFVGLLLGVLYYFGVHQQLLLLLEWMDAQGPLAALLFIVLMAVVVVLLLPGIFVTVGAGFVFGVVEGTLYIVIGTVIGAALAFLIARYMFGARAARFILQRSSLQMVNEEMTRHDFKVVMLTRLIPFFPGKLSNYFFGLTSFSFRGFVLGSLVGFIPFSLHNAYVGSLAADLASVGEGVGRSPLQWAFYGLGFVATVVAVVWFNKLARRALASYTTVNGGTQDAPAKPVESSP